MYGEVASILILTPSIKKATESTVPSASAAVAAMLTTEPVINPAPFAGDVILTVGAMFAAPNVCVKLGIVISPEAGLDAT